MKFQNRYGQLELLPVSEVMPVDDIHGKDISQSHMFTIEIAEQMALITDNCGIQIAPFKLSNGHWVCYVVAQKTPRTGQIMRIACMAYAGGNPSHELEKAREDGAVMSTFHSPYQQYQTRVGESFTIIRKITKRNATAADRLVFDREVLPVYLIRFEDGVEITAWPEEVETHDHI